MVRFVLLAIVLIEGFMLRYMSTQVKGHRSLAKEVATPGVSRRAEPTSFNRWWHD